jgi:hypothetical protein
MAVKSAKAAEARATRAKDPSPNWAGCESWNTDKFYSFFHDAMQYYHLNHKAADLKGKVINWMGRNDYTKDQIKQFKITKDWRCGPTLGAIAANLIRGMPAIRADFNQGKSSESWLRKEIERISLEGDSDVEPEITADSVSTAYVPSVQERLREVSLRMTEEIEDALERFQDEPDSFDPKAFKLMNLLKGKQVKAAHARIIRDLYKPNLAELQEAYAGKDEQLKEGYSHVSKKNLKKLVDFYNEIISTCEMLGQEAKVNRKPRAKKAVSKDKLIAKLKYKKTDEQLKMVSIAPADIVGAKELWVFNIKTRKLGKYVAGDFSELSIKGTTIINFDESKSVQKTLRKPLEQLKEFKSAGKVQLRKFLDDINAVDIKLNGRVNEETLLLRVD